MKRKIVFLLILLGIVGLIAGVITLIRGSSPKQGVLKINASPESSVFLDSKQLGKTPYQDKVAEGEYEIKVVPESITQAASPWTGTVNIRGNLLTYVNVELGESEFSSAADVLWLEKVASNQSEISVVTNPDGASITVDGEAKGVSPISLSGITPGEHVIAVSSPGFAPRTIKAKTTAGYKLYMTIKLALSPKADLTTMPSATPSASASATLTITPTGTVKESPTATGKVTPTVAVEEPEKPYVVVKDTPTGYLRVRFEPTTAASEAGKVKPGEKYSILDTKNGWYQITISSGTTGWISGQYATKVE